MILIQTLVDVCWCLMVTSRTLFRKRKLWANTAGHSPSIQLNLWYIYVYLVHFKCHWCVLRRNPSDPSDPSDLRIPRHQGSAIARWLGLSRPLLELVYGSWPKSRAVWSRSTGSTELRPGGLYQASAYLAYWKCGHICCTWGRPWITSWVQFLKKCISMAIHLRQLCCTLYITFKGFLHLP